MKSVRFPGKSKAIVVDVEKPKPGPDELLLDIIISGICGSDMKPFHAAEECPVPIGHEMVGRVVQVPRGSVFKEGDRVAVNVLKGCGQCRHCRADNVPFCHNLGIVLGGHSEYVAAPESTCILVPEDVPDDAAVILGADTLGVAYHLNQRLQVKEGEQVLVAGVGPVGLGAVALFAHLGADVIAYDKSAYRLELSKKLGAKAVVDAASPDAMEQVRALSGGDGPIVGVECAGKDVTLSFVLDAVDSGARVGIAGENPSATVSPSRHFIRKELAVYGSWYYRVSEAPALFELYREGLPAAGLVTHRYPLEDAQAAHDKMASGESGKVVLVQN